MRCPQPIGRRGSLKWMQWAANDPARRIDPLILARVTGAEHITWLSPRSNDDFAEYRDASFLATVGVPHLADALQAFWPRRGPQWDGLARTERGQVLLFEAKAHVGELCSPPTKATGLARDRIGEALTRTALHCGAKPLVPWTDGFYQLANRFAHLHFLRLNGIDARLGLIDFVGDADMHGPMSSEAWKAAYTVVHHVMGLSARSPLCKFVFHVRPDVRVIFPESGTWSSATS